MTVRNLQDTTKGVIIFIGFVLVFVLRWESMMVIARINQGLVAFQQIPIWRDLSLESSSESIVQMTRLIEQGIEISNKRVVPLVNAQGILLYIQDKKDEAVFLWQEAKLDPAQMVATQGKYAQTIDQNDIAIAWYKEALLLNPDNLELWHSLGELYEQNGANVDAKKAYTEAVERGKFDSVGPLADLWRDEGNYDEAIETWYEALETFSDNPDRLHWWRGLTNSLRATGQWDFGLLAVESALQEFPKDARLHVEKGAIIYGQTGDADKAMNAIYTATVLDDTFPGPYVTAAGLMAAERQYEAAYDWYTEAIERDPDKPAWYVARGHMARAANNLPLSLDAFQVAINRFPNFPPAYFGIAKVYQQLGDKKNAVKAIEQALQSREKISFQDYIQAGEIYEWSGDLDKAISVYQLALTLDPKSDLASQALQRLQN